LKEQLSALLSLQKLDNEIAEENARCNRLPERIQEKERQITNLEKKYQDEKDALKELQLRIKRREIDAKAVNDKIDKHRNELYGGKISDIKELKQLQKVIESLQGDCDKVEEDLLLLMEQEDAFRFKITKMEKELAESKAQLTEIKYQMEAEEDRIQQYIEKKRQEREKIAGKISDRVLMNRYLILWPEKNGEAIVEIEGSACSGCNLSLPSDILYHLQRGERLIICPNCNRILVWKEHVK